MSVQEQNPQGLSGERSQVSDVELLVHIESTLYTAVFADALDELGYRSQAMREYIRPIASDSVFAGWARTILCADNYHIPANPYDVEIQAVDSLLPGEVAVVAAGNSLRNAPWGELLSTAAVARGARGAVIDGLVRDVKKIQALGFPVFASGIKPVDSQGRGIVIDYNVPVECAGVAVNPGDLVVADFDGVVVVPAVAVTEAVRIATNKATRENHSREELKNGAFLSDVYKKYGVL